MAGISQDDPQAAQLYSQYQQVNQAIQQTTNQINANYQQLLATQIADAYKTIHAATNEVSAEQGYTFVFATRRGADLVQTTTLTGVTQEILARPLVTPPEAVDITDTIRLHLSLPTMEEITAKIQAEQEAQAAAALAAQEAAAESATETTPDATDDLPTPATEITDDE
jgi:septal ring factor EnvC (AmiA/AmiB activator)